MLTQLHCFVKAARQISNEIRFLCHIIHCIMTELPVTFAKASLQGERSNMHMFGGSQAKILHVRKLKKQRE
jgi:hypothetical protein